VVEGQCVFLPADKAIQPYHKEEPSRGN